MEANIAEFGKGETLDLISSLLVNPFSRRSDFERRAILNKDRPTPSLTIFQKDKFKTRTFNASWYGQHKWLCGSVVKNKLFCWPCLLLSKKRTVWSTDGFSDLKNISRGISMHASSSEHMHCFISLKQLSTQAHSISELLNEQERSSRVKYNAEVKKNREIFKNLIDLTCVLCKQELSFRGHDESSDSVNPGNFKAIFQLILNSNPELKQHWEGMGYFRGLSKTVQNELIECIQEEIQLFIDDAIQKTDFFSCIVDETTDITEKSQCSVVMRLVDEEGKMQEFFLGFYNIDENRSAEGLYNVLQGVLRKYDNAEKRLVAQTYDGASVMAGELRGLQAKVREFAPQAIFTHCYAHRLNLVLQQSCSQITAVKIFFSTLQGIPSFFHRSSKRSSILERILDKRIPRHSEVRWNSNAKVVSSVLENREKLIQVFSEIVDSPDSNAVSIRQAEGFKHSLLQFHFVFHLLIFNDIFHKTEILYSILQKKISDVQLCSNAVSDCLSFIRSMRTDDKASEYISRAEATTSNGPSVRRHELADDNCATGKYRQLYFQIVDNISVQLNSRFSDVTRVKFIQLGDPQLFQNHHENFPVSAFDILMSTYGQFFDSMRLKNELATLYSPHHESTFRNKTISELIRTMVENETKEILPEVYKLLCLIATIPATSASAERSFSCMKRIKTFLRSTMTQHRLSALAMASIEAEILTKLQERSTWYEDVIDKYAKKKERRVHLLYK